MSAALFVSYHLLTYVPGIASIPIPNSSLPNIPFENLTALNYDIAPGWVPSANSRGTADLLYSCAITLTLCVYTSGGKNSYWTTRPTPPNCFRNPINIATFHTHSTMQTPATTMVKRKHHDGEYVTACVLSEISGNSNRETARITGLSHQEVPRVVKRARIRGWSPSQGPPSTKQVHPAHGGGWN